jgi:hypothetical protein
VAIKKWYWKNATASGSSHGSLSEVAPTANTGALATGWTVDTVASGYSLMIWGTRRASSTFAAPAQPASAPTTTDCVRTTDGTGTGKYTGSFVAGTWTLASTLSSAVMSGSNVKLEFRLWRSVNADGSSAVEITSGAVETNAFVGVDSGDNLVSGTFSPGVVTLTGEYLFLQVACRINALGSGGATEDANISIFQMVGATPGVAAITSPEFTASGSEMIPKFQAAGAAVSNTIAVSPAWPTHLTGDIALLFVESANEAITLSTPAGFVEITNSPQGTGTAAGTAATRLAVFWCRATSGAMGAPTVTDPGDHVIAQILTFRGCTPSGTPFNISAGDTAAASTTVTVPGATSTAYACLVVLAAANPVDSASDQSIKNWVNANLANIVEVASSNTISGNGGGFSVATGEFYTPGAYGSTTCTRLTSTVQGRMSIALMPPVLTDDYPAPRAPTEEASAPGARPWLFGAAEDLPVSVAGPANGTLSATQDANTLSSAGSVRVDGALAATAADGTLSAAGSVRVDGALAATQADASISAAGSVRVDGALAISQADGAISAAGSVRVDGALAATQAGATLSAAGSVRVDGALGATQADATLSSAGTVSIAGSLAATQGDGSLSAAGSVRVDGALGVTAEDAAVSSAGSVRVAGDLSATLDDASLAATASVAVTGALSQQQDDATLASTATVVPVIIGALAAVQDDAVGAAAASVQVTGALDQQLDDASLVSAGSSATEIHGALSVTLDDATLSSIAILGAALPSHAGISVAVLEHATAAISCELAEQGRITIAVDATPTGSARIRVEAVPQGTTHISVEAIHE